MGSSKPSSSVRAKAIEKSSVKERSSDDSTKVIRNAGTKKRPATAVDKAARKIGDKESPQTTLTRVVENTDVQIIPAPQSRYARYPSGLPDPLPGTNPLRNDPSLLSSLGLSWTEAQMREFRHSTPVYAYKALANPYPPKHRWIAESV